MKSQTMSRRGFLAATAGVAAGTGPLVRARPPDRLRTALVGTGWWGMNILREAIAARRSKIVALCDVEPDALEIAAEQVTDLNGDSPKRYRDFRELFEREELDVAIVATPDHWHVLNGIAALKTGAHLFVEKPTGHTIAESRALVEAARQAERVVQVGLHRRIGPHYVSAMKFLRDGGAGKIGMVRAFAHSRGGAEHPSANNPPPEGMDWDLYCGPAPWHPFNRKIHPGGFRNFLDFANGTLGDWGVHWLDQVLWWSEERFPKQVYSTGGRPIKGAPVFNSRGQTTDAPDSQVAVYKFESFTAVWEHRRFAGNEAEKHRIGCYFYGTKGTLHIGWRDGWTFYPDRPRDPGVHRDAQIQEPDGHNIKLLWANFIAAIDRGLRPVADVEIAHRSTTMALLGMLSYKLGRSIDWDGEKETIPGDPAASRLLRRAFRAPWVYPV